VPHPILTNRQTVSAQATLLNHAGGSHQIKVNKSSATATASLLYQDAFSGRAEIGLAGNDDFSVKVSADGGARRWRRREARNCITSPSWLPARPLPPQRAGRSILMMRVIYCAALTERSGRGSSANFSGFHMDQHWSNAWLSCEADRRVRTVIDFKGAHYPKAGMRPVKARFQAFSVSQFHGMSSSRRFIL
jgi:hypothetical protein